MALLDYQILNALVKKSKKEGYAPVNFGSGAKACGFDMVNLLTMLVSWAIALLAAYLNWGHTMGVEMYVRILCALIAGLFGTTYIIFHLLFFTGGMAHDMMSSDASSFHRSG